MDAAIQMNAAIQQHLWAFLTHLMDFVMTGVLLLCLGMFLAVPVLLFQIIKLCWDFRSSKGGQS